MRPTIAGNVTEEHAAGGELVWVRAGPFRLDGHFRWRYRIRYLYRKRPIQRLGRICQCLDYGFDERARLLEDDGVAERFKLRGA